MYPDHSLIFRATNHFILEVSDDAQTWEVATEINLNLELPDGFSETTDRHTGEVNMLISIQIYILIFHFASAKKTQRTFHCEKITLRGLPG